MELQEVIKYHDDTKITDLNNYDFFASEIIKYLTPIEQYFLCKATKTFNKICNNEINDIIEKGIKLVDRIDYFYKEATEDYYDINVKFIVNDQKLNVTFNDESVDILPEIKVFSLACDHQYLYVLDISGILYQLYISNIYHHYIAYTIVDLLNILTITSSEMGIYANTLHGTYHIINYHTIYDIKKIT